MIIKNAATGSQFNNHDPFKEGYDIIANNNDGFDIIVEVRASEDETPYIASCKKAGFVLHSDNTATRIG